MHGTRSQQTEASLLHREGDQALAQLPREGVEIPSLEGFQRGVDEALGAWVSTGLGSVRFTVWHDDLTALSQPKQFSHS